jgi:sulfite dehydrogenase (cytochrome) subunit A
MNRRQWLHWTAVSGLAYSASAGCSRPVPTKVAALEAVNHEDTSPRFPGKVAMRVVNNSPPCLETPWEYFRFDLTPNDAFYVRWHLQFIPTTIDLRTWRLRVGGHVRKPLELTLDELRRMESASVVAVNQCSGNSRGLFEPHMPGAQWGNGAMGNARWTGVRLSTVLQAAGIEAGAVDVAFAALDRGGYSTVPDFTKSLSIAKAREPEVLLAYEMNGEPLPMLNGFPLRLIVPGWYATYWVKALAAITVLSQPFDGFWMSKAYRIPTTPNAVEQPGKLAEKTVPISRMNVRSFFVTPEANLRLAAGRACPLEGIAFDGGDGIQRVEVSLDGGTSWSDAELGPDHGPFSFRRWHKPWTPQRRGQYRLQVRATNRAGHTQPTTAGWNRAGYMRNVIEERMVEVG